MAKAIITIDDEDENAPGGFSLGLEFDPPPPRDKNGELEKTVAPMSAQIAVIMVKAVEAEMGIVESKPETEH